MRNFNQDRPWIEEEFRNAEWDNETGLDPEALRAGMLRIEAENPQLPMILLRGKIFSFIAENARLAINPKSMFSGKIDLGVEFGEAAGQGVYSDLYYRTNERVLNEEIPEMMKRKDLAGRIGIGFGVADFWHTMPDWERILRLGLPGMRDALTQAREKHSAEGTLTREMDDFYVSALAHVNAVISYVRRLRIEGEKKGLTDWARCLAQLETGAPQTLYEAMQLQITYLELEEMGVERGRTLGRIDALFAPFYRKELAEGTSEEEIRNLFRYFFMHFQAARRFASQPFAIGGKTPDGLDGDENLIMLMLDVYDELDIRNPKIQVRVTDALPEKILRKCLKLIRQGNSSVVFINDATVMKAYEKIGIPAEDAAKWVPFGCYEPMLPGLEDAMIGASWCNMAKAAEFAINGGADLLTGEVLTSRTPENFETFDAFYACVKRQIREIIAFIREAIEAELPYTMRINPSPLYSASIDSCVRSGRDVFGGGMKYHNASIKCFAIGTLTDAVLAVKRFVFEKKEVTFEELRQILKDNWEGQELLRRRILKDDCKYANNHPEADEIACDLYKCMAEEIVGRKTGFGGVYRMGGDSITNCISFARSMGASADGRKSGDPVSKNFCASTGMERNGVTAYMESAFRFDYTDFSDAAVVDLVVHKSAVQGEAGLDAMLAMLRLAFRKGIFALQGNVLDRQELLDARKNPEAYRNLQVRLCGWNEYWINMSPEKQNAFLKRLEA